MRARPARRPASWYGTILHMRGATQTLLKFIAGVATGLLGTLGVAGLIALLRGNTVEGIAAIIIVALPLAVFLRAQFTRTHREERVLVEDVGTGPLETPEINFEPPAPMNEPPRAPHHPRAASSRKIAIAARAQPREIPYWLQVTSISLGMITGVGGMVIALVK